MEITPESARDSLTEVEKTMLQVRRSVAWRGTDLALIVWGAVWMGCYLATHLLLDQPQRIWAVWAIGTSIGIASMIGISIASARREMVHSELARQIGRRVFWSWFALFVFADLWLVVLWPWHPLQLNAFIVMLVMFAYVMVGLWMESRFFIGLGLAVAIATLMGFLLTVLVGFPYYNLWMAAAGGGALLGSGIYIRLAWR